MANMMGGGSNVLTGRSSFSRPSSSSNYQRAPTVDAPIIAPRSRSDSIEALAKYPYLYAAAMQRPQVYESPYPTGGGFTSTYLPDNAITQQTRPKSMSLSEDFLMKRTPSQQEHVKAHVRQISVDKALQHQANIEKPRKKVMPPPSPLQVSQSHHNQQKVYTPLSSGSLQHQQHHSSQPYTISQTLSTPSYPSTFSPNSYTNNNQGPMHHLEDLSPHTQSSPFYSHQAAIPGPQYSSPQDFQLQMQREIQLEAQQHEWGKGGQGHGGYENFLRGLQNVGSHAHPEEKEEGALRQGMRGGGGEMLPMMNDSF